MADPLQKRHRHLPHWTLAGSTYFITFRLAKGELTPHERQLAFSHLCSGDGTYYKLFAAVVMPDHVHLITAPNAGVDLSRMMKGIKGVSARLINEARQTRGRLWQDESFDRILRDRTEFWEKWNYIHQNPEKSGLVDCADDYPWLFLIEAG